MAVKGAINLKIEQIFTRLFGRLILRIAEDSSPGNIQLRIL
jgi:hypothetical protein